MKITPIIEKNREGKITLYNFAEDERLKIKSFVVPSNVQRINLYAFAYCKNLERIVIPNSVTSISDCAFDGCCFTKDNFINNSSLDAESNNYWGATIIDKVLENGLCIKNNVIVGCRCTNEEINIPYWLGITKIEKAAFYGCSTIKRITIPSTVKRIGDMAFGLCTELEAMNIPEGITKIGNGTFNRCFKLASVTIPDSVESIGSHAFEECKSLTSINIPHKVTHIGSFAFNRCYELSNVTFNNNIIDYLGTDIFSFTKVRYKLKYILETA